MLPIFTTDVDAMDIEPNIRDRRHRRTRKEKRTKEKKSKQTGQEPWFISLKIHGYFETTRIEFD